MKNNHAEFSTEGEIPEQSEFITYQLSRLNSKLTRQATQILRKNSELTLVQWRIVSIIATMRKGTFTELVEHSGMDAGLVSRNIKLLIEAGDIESEIDENDHRRATLRLTERGKGQHSSMLPIMRRRQKHLLKDVPPEDLLLFRQMIKQLERRAKVVDFETKVEAPA